MKLQAPKVDASVVRIEANRKTPRSASPWVAERVTYVANVMISDPMVVRRAPTTA